MKELLKPVKKVEKTVQHSQSVSILGNLTRDDRKPDRRKALDLKERDNLLKLGQIDENKPAPVIKRGLVKYKNDSLIDLKVDKDFLNNTDVGMKRKIRRDSSLPLFNSHLQLSDNKS